MVLMALFITFITTPIVMAVYKPARPSAPYKRRTVGGDDEDGDLRVLACFHGYRNIPTLLNLVELSRGTRRRLIVCAMHLVELSERSSAISMVHRTRRNALPFFSNNRASSSETTTEVAFEAFRQLSTVRVRPMTAISVLDTIHRDIIDSAASKRAAVVIVPYHKTVQADGSFYSLGSAYHAVNKRVLREAPCSVAILVDRGLGGHSQVAAQNVAFTVAVLFFGGPDDREAVAYATRMAEHLGVAVTMSRFQPSRAFPEEGDAAADEAAVEVFKAKVTASVDDGSVRFEEQEARAKEEVLEAIGSLSKCNVFVVGRMPPTAPLVENADELGPVGSYLASPEFKTSASVLVIKRYDPATNPKSLRFDPKARPPVATDVDDEEMGGAGATVVPVPWSPSLSELA